MKTSRFLALAALFLGGCAPKNPAQDAAKAAKSEVKAERDTFSGLKSATLNGGELSGGDAQGRPLWRLSAKTIRASGGVLGSGNGLPKTATLTDARATLFQAGKPESTLQAPIITFFRLKNGIRLQLSKGVRGQTQGAWTGKRGAVSFNAPRADVDVQKRLISASGGVQMKQGEVAVRAQTLRAQTSLQKVQLTGQIRADSAKNGRFEAKTALYDWKSGRVRAQTVTATQGQTRLSGDTLEADTGVSSGVLTGQVRAQSPQGQASAPRLDFNWKADQIVAQSAVFTSPQGTARAQSLVTDSKLRLASAKSLTLKADGATLRADSAQGFDGLSKMQAQNLNFSRADLKFSAPSASARKVGAKWVLEAQGGARGQNAQGKVSAPRVIWDEGSGRVAASLGVTLEKDGAILRGQTLKSDAGFQNATLSGQVRGQMADGSVLTAQTLEKRGAKFLAKSGATAQLKNRGALGVLTLQAAQIGAQSDGSSAVATGGVSVVTSVGATAKAPRATYNRQTATVTASGGVDFFDPARGIRTKGDTLVYSLKTGQAKLSGSNGQGSLGLFDGKKLF